MPLQNSGQISLNDLHVEAGGTSGTQCSMNDSDIRGLLNAAANSQMTFSGFYGASSGWSTTGTVSLYSGKFGAAATYNNPILGGVAQGSLADTTVDILGGAYVASVSESAGSGPHEIAFQMFTKADPFTNPLGTNEPSIWSGGNSGWSTLTFGGASLSRASATTFYVNAAGENRETVNWRWTQTGSYPVTGLTSTNSAFTISIS